MQIHIHKQIVLKDINESFRQELIQKFQFTNPKWLENERMGRWNKDTPRLLEFYGSPDDKSLIIPRGYIRQLIRLCRGHGIDHTIIDQRRALPEIDLTFKGQLKSFQQIAAERMLAHEFGVLDAPTGAGKTVIALYMIAKRKQPALILVHTKELAFQWIERITTFLDLENSEIGLIGAGKKTTGARITVALVQSLYKCAEMAASQIGFLVVDESHRCPSRTFTEAVVAFDARYMLGLSATPWRRDQLS